MLALPPTANSQDVSIADGDVMADADGALQDVDGESPRDDASTTAQVDDREEDTPDINLNLTNLDMDQSSVYETQVGSDMEDNAPAADNPGAGEEIARQQSSKKEQATEQGAGENKALEGQNDSSTTNSDEAADSDAKTADTVGTSTSVEESAKNSRTSKCLRQLLACSYITNTFVRSVHSWSKV